MKINYKKYGSKALTALTLTAGLALTTVSCKKSVLTEKPTGFLNPDVTLVNKAGFESAITGLHTGARDLYFGQDGSKQWWAFLGTDEFMTGDPTLADFNNYPTWLTPVQTSVTATWNLLYSEVITRANEIIDYANRPTAQWASDAEKNAEVAEARFFRGWAHNYLAEMYGGVPIVDQFYTYDKIDFTRATRDQVYDFARQDLEFAAQWLPATTTMPGRITKGAANHLLAEVYINLKQYDKAIAAATAVIGSGQYQLMTTRFGSTVSQPGDVFSDLFRDNNQNLAANKETIWAIQMEYLTPGGIALANQGNTTLRAFGNRYWNIQDPDKKAGMVVADSLGRGVGWCRPTNYLVYNIWANDAGDIRNSQYNIRREFYYNNPASRFLGQKVDRKSPLVDTTWDAYPTIRKIEGLSLAGASYGRTFKEFYMMRLAETYLLRAEAYFRKGDLPNAAIDINTVRSRAKAAPISAAQVTEDFILDERARELMLEEPRRLTLSRMGRLVDRTKIYNPKSGPSIVSTNELYPIPQTTIDANTAAKIDQNPGYNQ